MTNADDSSYRDFVSNAAILATIATTWMRMTRTTWSTLSQAGEQICRECKQLHLKHLMAKFTINASSAIQWPYLQPMHVEPTRFD